MTSSEARPYTELGERLDQGDIVLDVPWGIIPAPVTVCRSPHGIDASSGKATFCPATEAKDAFQKNGEREIVHALARRGPVLVLWHGCQIDKFAEFGRQDKATLAIAPILPIDVSNEVRREAIRSGRHRSSFHLPPFSSSAINFPESFADVRFIWSVRQAILEQRVTTLGPEARSLLCAHLFAFFTRQTIQETAVCPACKAVVPTESFFRPAAE